MKTTKIIILKVELEMSEEDALEIVKEYQEEEGETYTTEQIFESYVEDFEIPGKEWFTEELNKPLSSRWSVNVEKVEVL